MGLGHQPAENVPRIFNNPVGRQMITRFDAYILHRQIGASSLVEVQEQDAAPGHP